MKKLERYLRANTILLITYMVIYFIICFVGWDFYNLVEWFKSIPEWSSDNRAMLLTGFLFIQFIKWWYIIKGKLS